MDNKLYIERFFSDATELMKKISRREITRVIRILFRAWKEGQWVFVMGNGGSASNATHFAADLAKTVDDTNSGHGLRAMSLSDNIPLMSAVINDCGWDNLYSEQLRTYYPEEAEKAIGIGLSVHGGSGKDKAGLWSQNILKGLRYIKDNGGMTIGFVGFDGGAMKNLVDVCVLIPADSTPLVESFHSVLHHLIVFRLKEMIEKEKKRGV